MGEQTGDLKDLRETKFKEINTKLKRLSVLSIDELKDLYNELSESKEEYLKYMMKLGVKNDKACIIAKIVCVIIISLTSIWAIMEWVSLGTFLLGISLVSATCLHGYNEIKDIAKQTVLENYDDALTAINNNILVKEKQPNFELKSIFPNKKVAMQCLDIIYGEDAGKEILGEEKQLTLKRDLTKDNN